MNTKFKSFPFVFCIAVSSILISSCTEKTKEKKAEENAIDVIPATTFHSDYKQYKGKQVTISGTVAAPEGQLPVGALSSGRYLFLDGGSLALIQCNFLPSENSKLIHIKQKDNIVVTGFCDETFYAVTLEKAILVTVNGKGSSSSANPAPDVSTPHSPALDEYGTDPNLIKWSAFAKDALVMETELSYYINDNAIISSHDAGYSFFRAFFNSTEASWDQFETRRQIKQREEERKKLIGKKMLIRNTFKSDRENFKFDFERRYFRIPVPGLVETDWSPLNMVGEYITFEIPGLRVHENFGGVNISTLEAFYPLRFSSEADAEAWQHKNDPITVEILCKFTSYKMHTEGGPNLSVQLLGMCIYEGTAQNCRIHCLALNRGDVVQKLKFASE